MKRLKLLAATLVCVSCPWKGFAQAPVKPATVWPLQIVFG
jgi:hypothetical protein